MKTFLTALGALLLVSLVTKAQAQACMTNGECLPSNACEKGGCIEGNCVFKQIDCDDQNPCTIDSCLNGNCLHTPISCSGDLNNLCSAGKCVDGICKTYILPDDHCGDPEGCTKWECDPTNGCIEVDVPGCVCNDDGVCDDKETCESCPNDCCTECKQDADCDDGNLCTVDSCEDGMCVRKEKNCDREVPCIAFKCVPGVGCVEETIPNCCNNNGICESNENCETCPNDCKKVSAPDEAVCNNGVCEAWGGENTSNCENDCAGLNTGKPDLRWYCGSGFGFECSTERCNSNGFTCQETKPAASCCGDGTCDGGEDLFSCAVDCKKLATSDGACGQENDDCEGNEDCCSSFCFAGKCTPDTTLDEECGQENDECEGNEDCCSWYCESGRCAT